MIINSSNHQAGAIDGLLNDKLKLQNVSECAYGLLIDADTRNLRHGGKRSCGR